MSLNGFEMDVRVLTPLGAGSDTSIVEVWLLNRSYPKDFPPTQYLSFCAVGDVIDPLRVVEERLMAVGQSMAALDVQEVLEQ